MEKNKAPIEKKELEKASLIEKRNNNNILLISTSKETFHEEEFVRPIEDIAKKFAKVHRKRICSISPEELGSDFYSLIIICGTSLLDNQFDKCITNLKEIKHLEKPILGICAGMQIIAKIYGIPLVQFRQIGFIEFIYKNKKKQGYFLHTRAVAVQDIAKNRMFECMSSDINKKYCFGFKHKNKEIMGLLFHPEVRNKEILEEFIKNNKN